ncbi:MAG: adenosine deaminase [Enhygromyxa sp.]
MGQLDLDSFVLSPDLDALISELPKVELHVHLEGSIVPELALRLAARRGVRLPGAEEGVEGLRRAYRFRSFRDFLEVYVALSSTLQQAEDFADAVFGVAEQLAAQRVRWAEVTFTPMTHVARGVDADAMLDGLAQGRARAREELGVELAWVFDVVRSLPEQADATLELALRGREHGVIAIGVGGPEGPKWSVAPLASMFARARAEGLKSVPHAGEQWGAPSLRETLELLAPDRIGHGVRCLEDPEITRELIDRQVKLEVCPSSNVALGVVASVAEHPLPRLLEAGLAVSLGSDDPPLFGTTLVDEYRRCAHAFGWGPEELLAIAAAAVEHSFMPEDRKQALRAEQARVARS